MDRRAFISGRDTTSSPYDYYVTAYSVSDLYNLTTTNPNTLDVQATLTWTASSYLLLAEAHALRHTAPAAHTGG